MSRLGKRGILSARPDHAAIAAASCARLQDRRTGSPSQTPVHAAPSGTIELLVPYRQRTGALRFGDQRAMALAGALCLVAHAVTGFTNKSLRGQVAGLLGKDYSSSQMS